MLFVVSETTETANKLVKATQHCLNLGIQQVKPDNYLVNTGCVISRYAMSQGFSVVYEYCGHGVGIHYHEDPQFEHAVLVTETGYVVLTDDSGEYPIT
jgi:methionyl aminopeptidase